VAEKYGWTLDYILWGISFLNLHMMLADCISTYYDSKSKDKEEVRVINADDPQNYELTKTPDYGW
jgi:hypothetical protein